MLERKLAHDRAAVLSPAEVATLARQVRRAAGRLITDSPARVRVEDGVRWAAVRARCQQARAERGLRIEDVAVALALPQYRLKAIEAGTLAELRPDMARRYFRYLGIDGWFERWCRANPRLAKRAGLLRIGSNIPRTGRRPKPVV